MVKQGDIIKLDFNPQAGHEQAGRRPALVISGGSFHRYANNLAAVCPITNTLTPFPLHVTLDRRTQTTGVIMCEQVKALDMRARRAEYKEMLPEDLLEKARQMVSAIFDTEE